MTRTINPLASAIGHALRLAPDHPLRRAAVRYVAQHLRRHKGSTGAAAAGMGVSQRSVTQWVTDAPELAEVRDEWIQRGPVPERLR